MRGGVRTVGQVPDKSAPIEVVDLVKRYGRVTALRGLSFRVFEGEIYGLLGPNGAGKTTTLKILVGLLSPQGGRAYIMGRDVVRRRVDALKYVGYIPENPVLFRNLTVREFLEMIGALRGINREELSDSIERYLEAFHIKDKEDEPASNLSRGMIQKVLATAAFIVRPKVLIMDEPMMGMDPRSQHVFKEEVRRLASEGVAVLLSSHLLDMVERFCTRVGIISGGKLIAEGSVEELRRVSGENRTLEEVFLQLVMERGQDIGAV